MKHGYLRVSTPLQTFDQQEAQLRTYGVRSFEKEVVSGKKTGRPVLTAIMEELRRGDELHVTRLDRLGRTARELHTIAQELEAREVVLVIGGAKYDPTTPMGKVMFGIFATFAEWEADVLSERTSETMAQRRAMGLSTGGRKKKLTDRQEIALFHAVEAGITITSLADRYSVSRTTIRRAVQREKAKRQLKTDPELRRAVKEMTLDMKRVEAELDKAWADAEPKTTEVQTTEEGEE